VNLHIYYISWQDTCVFKIFYCLRMLQLSYWSIRQDRKYNFPFLRLSGLCLQNYLDNNVAVVYVGGREFDTQMRYTGVEKEW